MCFRIQLCNSMLFQMLLYKSGLFPITPLWGVFFTVCCWVRFGLHFTIVWFSNGFTSGFPASPSPPSHPPSPSHLSPSPQPSQVQASLSGNGEIFLTSPFPLPLSPRPPRVVGRDGRAGVGGRGSKIFLFPLKLA